MSRTPSDQKIWISSRATEEPKENNNEESKKHKLTVNLLMTPRP